MEQIIEQESKQIKEIKNNLETAFSLAKEISLKFNYEKEQEKDIGVSIFIQLSKQDNIGQMRGRY